MFVVPCRTHSGGASTSKTNSYCKGFAENLPADSRQRFFRARSNHFLGLVIEIGAVAEGFFKSHALPPFGDFGMVAADKDFGDFPAAEVGRTGIVGKIENVAAVRQSSVQSAGLRFLRTLQQAEGFVVRGGFIAESAGEKAGDGIEDQGSREFAAREHEIS